VCVRGVQDVQQCMAWCTEATDACMVRVLDVHRWVPTCTYELIVAAEVALTAHANGE
jgi:hypothetical protein